MIETFQSGGYIMWVILAAAGAMIWRTASAVVSLRRRAADVRGEIDSVAFWGGFAALLGVLGTVAGLSQAARAIARAGEVDAALAWSGIGVTLITTLFGLATFALALLIWVALRAVQARG